MHVGQAVLAAFEFERQLFVIDAHTVQDRGVQIVNMDRIVRNIVREVVRSPEGDSRPDPSARQPHGKTAAMMVSTVVVAFQLALAVDGPTKLTPPDHKCIV